MDIILIKVIKIGDNISKIVYTQEIKNLKVRNKEQRAKLNYNYTLYIGHRPKVLKNMEQRTGLMGKVGTNEILHFKDSKDIAKTVLENTKKGITIYEGMIAIKKEDTKKLNLEDLKSWENYITKHINTIREENSIKREDFEFICAVHEKDINYHTHILFWDKSQKTPKNFQHYSIPDKIRKKLIKDTFSDEILEYAKTKDLAVKNVREITDKLVDDFMEDIKMLDNKKYNKLKGVFKDKNSKLDKNFIEYIFNESYKIKQMIPKGRIAYKLLEPQVKEEVDKLVDYVLRNNEDLKNICDEYVKSKLNIANFYSEKNLDEQEQKYKQEIEKIIANKLLGIVKSINRLEYEYKKQETIAEKQKELIKQSIFDLISLFCVKEEKERSKHNEIKTELSKEAKKEIYLKNKDKGYEH